MDFKHEIDTVSTFLFRKSQEWKQINKEAMEVAWETDDGVLKIGYS